ncbi:MAG: hypothetical protein KDD28_29150, partial [Phaeodactylibacter sp.]|nr:hypothetical protein [Phaeodactylibacter sp.]
MEKTNFTFISPHHWLKALAMLLAFSLMGIQQSYAQTDITLCVDFSCGPAAIAPSVLGPFNGENAGANPVIDQGNGIYCATVSLPDGDQQFRFFTQSAGQETLDPNAPCAVVNGTFVNRVVTVAGTPMTVTYAWNSCDPDCGTPPGTTDVTLCVDLSCFQSVTAPSVAGTFNGFDFGANPLTDQGNGTYCATVALANGLQEYKFFFQEQGQEDLTPGDPCTMTTGPFTNRVVNVTGTPVTETYGWETCEPDCGAPPVLTDVTLCVDLSCLPSSTAPSVLGPFNGENAGANMVTDPDGDGIYCATVALAQGDQQFRFFTQEENQENLDPGAACTVTNGPFVNRVITVGSTPFTVTYGWESCGLVCTPPPGADVTFCVNVGCTPGVNTVNLFGQFNGFNPVANLMDDSDGDGVYCTTVFLRPGPQEYRFLINGGGGATELAEPLSPGDACTVTNGGFTNRIITVADGVDQAVTFLFGSCQSALTDPDITFSDITLSCVGDEVVTVTGGATPAGGEYSGQGVTDNGDGTFDVDLSLLDEGDYTLTYTIDIELGCVATETATLTVDKDTWAPLIIYPSQDIVVTLDPCDQDPAIVFFEVGVTDDCDGDHFPAAPGGPVVPGSEFTVTVFSGPSLGTVFSAGGDRFMGVFQPGTYQVQISAEDAVGNFRDEDFQITVLQGDPPPTNLICNSVVNATLNGDCQRFITADMVLEGDFGCAQESDFQVNIVNDDD